MQMDWKRYTDRQMDGWMDKQTLTDRQTGGGQGVGGGGALGVGDQGGG